MGKYIDEMRRVDYIPADYKGFDDMLDIEDRNHFGSGAIDSRSIWRPEQDVGSGAWVYITTSPPVSKNVAPKRHHIYWAIPVRAPVTIEYFDNEEDKRIKLSGECIGRDRFTRQAVKVLTREEITLFTDEYTIVPEDRLNQYKEMGYEMVPIEIGINDPINMEIVERGRVLVEEEREIIWALMLDGLSEEAACSEYFCGKHIDTSNRSMYYRPNKELYEYIVAYLGA